MHIKQCYQIFYPIILNGIRLVVGMVALDGKDKLPKFIEYFPIYILRPVTERKII